MEEGENGKGILRLCRFRFVTLNRKVQVGAAAADQAFRSRTDMHTTAVVSAPRQQCIGSRDNEAGSRTLQRMPWNKGYSHSPQSSSWLN